jgi:glyoxylase-like metal-dependent hydrolase (beta-lactamase superfamily II)
MPESLPRVVEPAVVSFFDPATWTVTHVVQEKGADVCAVIDPVLDYDSKSGRTGTRSADAVIAYLRSAGLTVDWILETHVHADHLTAAPYLQENLGGKIGIGRHIVTVQETFGALFNAGPDFHTEGRPFDRLFDDGDRFAIGALEGHVMHTPGHTPACVTYVIGDAAFVGDTLFMPDYGTARCDFPGGDAATLYRSIHRILGMPEDTRLFMCHDYGPGGRNIAWETTVRAQRQSNVHVHDGIDEAEFVAMRSKRDATLEMPTLILPAIQINMRAGRLPPPEDNGVRYLKIPLDAI